MILAQCVVSKERVICLKKKERINHILAIFYCRGHPHIHGMAWSDTSELNKKYPGLQTTFAKLKEREYLTQEDIKPLQKFVDATITCTTNLKEIKELLRPNDPTCDDDHPDCSLKCDPENCAGCCERCAKLIKERVEEVNTHHHTKTCRKHGPGCRFGIPRPPSAFTIIAQAMSDDEKKAETETVKCLGFIMGKVKARLKLVEEDLKERRKEDGNAKIEESLQDMLEHLFPDIEMSHNGKYITITETKEEKYKVKTALVKAAWRQNPNMDQCPLTNQATRERLQSAVYHYALSVISHGTKVVLKRELVDIFTNNYNIHWMWNWNGNMDIQPIFDYFACITYMTDYVCKPEKNISDLLKDVNKAKKKEMVSTRDLMWALAQAYLTGREMGESEAYYKLEPSLHYKQSNVKTVFITSGFPQNRWQFLRKCR